MSLSDLIWNQHRYWIHLLRFDYPFRLFRSCSIIFSRPEMGKNQAYKAMQRSRLSSSAGLEEFEDGRVDGTFHSPEWHAARLASLNTSHTITWEEFKKKQKEDEVKKGEMEADKDRMMRDYRAQLDVDRARKLAAGKNHSGIKLHRKKAKREKDLKKRSSKKRKHKKRESDSSSSSSSSESSSSDDDEKELKRSRSKSRSKRTKKEKRHRSKSKHSCSDDEGSGGGGPALTISQSKNILLTNLKILNSQSFQIAVIFSQSIKIEKTLITAPGDSPNTDGIHLHRSTSVAVTGATIATGDDCISVGEGVSDAWIEGVRCGPGHGISIGSLGDGAGETLVQNVTVSSVVFTGTQNGFRVKTWAMASSKGVVRGITFRHGVMNGVGNPILIEQNYCPVPGRCPNESSGIKISNVIFSDVNGTSSTPIAMKFDCSKSNPCQGIQLTNINLSYKGKEQILAKSFCRNVRGKNSGFVVPPSCLR